MTYQQSLEMIEKLKNIVWPFNKEAIYFFNFFNETDFSIIFFDGSKKEDKDNLSTLQIVNSEAHLPVAYVYRDNHRPYEMLYYDDKNIIYIFNLTLQMIEDSETNDPILHCPLRFKLELARFVRKMEK